VPVKEIIADIARPAILIWYRVKDQEKNLWVLFWAAIYVVFSP
jgi:hypothetical protein